jgi:outer membrane protein OmpA-like peptidoglycan-associated protein
MMLSIILHVAVFLALDHMKIALNFQQARELSTRPVNVRQVEVRPLDPENTATPENLITPPENPAALLEEIDLLSALPKDKEIDIKPDIQEAEYALQMQNPALKGDAAAIALEASAGMELDADLPELGHDAERLKPAEVGQVTVDPGAVPMDDNELGKFTDSLIKRGANGSVEKGALDGIASLDDLLGLPPNVLLGKKTMLPSDLLFEFNSAELRESAKVGLMKLALLMDRNPNLYCWIEGHTDLVGGDDFNLKLSVRRAEAVKNHLTRSLRMDAAKISTRGFGRYQPLVTGGTTEEQALNRRVEIRMRKTPPADDPNNINPKKAAVVGEAPPPAKIPGTPPPAKTAGKTPPHPKAILVKPKRALPVDDEDSAPPRPGRPPLRATPVEEFDPVSDDAPKATPVKPAPRAKPVAD